MEGTPKRQRAGSSSGEESPETPSPLSDSNKNDSGSRPSFLPSPRQSSATVGNLEGAPSSASPKRFTHSSHSGEIAIPQSPVGLQHSKFTNSIPPETPKSKNQESFLSPSLELQSPVHKPVVATQKPIREISNNLKSRLNYAYVKMQQNMLQHSKRGLDESIDDAAQVTNEVKPSSYSNVFAQDSDTESETLPSAIKETRNASKSVLAHDTMGLKLKDDLEDLAGENSAQVAFLKALQSPKKKQRSLSSTHPKITRTSSSSNSQPSEVEAIETLMSLSSPHKRRPSGSFDSALPPPTPPPVNNNSTSAATISASDITTTDSDRTSNPSDDSDSKQGPRPSSGSPKSTKPVKSSLHSEVQTDVETDVESQSE